MRLQEGYVNVVGSFGYDWSRTARSFANAYYLGIYPTDIGPSNDNVRYYGFPLRCLYPGVTNGGKGSTAAEGATIV